MEKSKKKIGFNRSLLGQILIPFIALIVLTGAVIGYASYSFSAQTTTNELISNVEKQMVTLNDSFDTFFEAQEDIANHYTEEQAFQNLSDNQEEVVSRLNDIQASNDVIKNVYIGTNEDLMVSDETLTLPDGYQPTTRPWFQEAVANQGAIIWTQPYLDANTNEMIMSVAKTIERSGQIVGVLSIDIDMASMIDLVASVQIADSGYAAILSDNGIFLAHPDPELVGEDVSEESYYQKIEEQNTETGIVEYQLEGLNKTLGYATNPTTGWVVVGAVNKGELQEKAAVIIGPIVTTVLIMLAIAAIISFFVARRIRRPIIKLQESMKQVEDGDLTVNLIQDRKDEIGQLSYSAHEMKSSIQEIIIGLKEAAAAVNEQSGILTRSSDEVREGSEQIASTMQELSSGAESQAHSSSNLSEMTEGFVSDIQAAFDNSRDMVESTDSVLQKTDQGASQMKKSAGQMSTIDHIVKDAVEKVQGLDQQSKKITKLVQVIEDIAEQTSLLSLNAAIEAARAGEHGKGFAVVADEVRKLADQVSTSVGDITDIVEKIQVESSEVTTSLQNSYKEVEAGTNMMNETEETFHQIESSVQEMAEKSRSISNRLQTIQDSSHKMNQWIADIASVSEESAAGVEEVTATAEQSSHSIEEVFSSAQQLSQLSNELDQQIDRFKTGEHGDSEENK
ncbi:methyl-accepting chemotaxis protein [Halobacillus litoralis]|uniref:methyl-accepting chemotaxis protein n=1 Tax=Halobacillus litoralis TaxID=45668 RepID=UPI001CD32894|nr:methyl-accepting chemotaxis protein [Halobacillus litoralis]MCA0971443.1 methyl-accepting chemotaxis protein [Halobacillus litoralis]